MPHQRSFRLGWQSENLARFILYKFSFLAQPAQVADDIGVDFFCTLFETRRTANNADLIPRNSFAIQIKRLSDSSNIDLTKHLPYLVNLELPFLLGIVDPNKMVLTVYSGELLTPFFAYKGQPGHLEVELCERSSIGPNYDGWQKEIGQGEHVLLFPKITEIAASIDDDELGAKVSEIRDICSSMLDNIASRINKQFMMKGVAPDHVLLFAGPESLQFFEINFIKRLSEAFFNLDWAYASIEALRPQLKDRFQLYESIYLQIVSFYKENNLPSLLTDRYNAAKRCIESS